MQGVQQEQSVSEEDIARAAAAGYRVEQGGAEDGELAGRWWWTTVAAGGDVVATPVGSFATSAEAWVDAVRAHREEEAEALGFSTVAEMEQHQAWLAQQQSHYAAAVAYQQTDEARSRAKAASREFGIPLDAIAFVEPPARQ